MISLRQDSQGFIRMSKHFPAGGSVSVTIGDRKKKVQQGIEFVPISPDLRRG
jgi:hypothetical protein